MRAGVSILLSELRISAARALNIAETLDPNMELRRRRIRRGAGAYLHICGAPARKFPNAADFRGDSAA